MNISEEVIFFKTSISSMKNSKNQKKFKSKVFTVKNQNCRFFSDNQLKNWIIRIALHNFYTKQKVQ